MTFLLCVLVAYLIGSISFALLASWLFRLPDPRSYGSGNPGATNVLRSGKKAAAIFTLIGDAAKGLLAVMLAKLLAPSLGLGAGEIAVCGLAAFLGHLYPLYFGFRGGKGVATALGVLLGLNVTLALAALLTFIVVALVSRYVSLASVVAAIVAAALSPWLLGWGQAAIAVITLCGMVVWRHRANMQRLFSGTENRLKSRRRGDPPPGPAV